MEAEDVVRCKTAGQQSLHHGDLVATHGRFAGLGRGEEEGEVVNILHVQLLACL
jgi:hypothetical protein